VRLFLPNFDKTAVEAVKSKLETDDGGLPTDIEINSVDAPRNTKVPAEAFAVVEKLPSYQVPGPVHRSQVARLHKLAALLSGDGLLVNAIKTADTFLVGVIEAERVRLESDEALAAMVKDVLTASVEVIDIHSDGSTTVTTEDYDTATADLDRLFAGSRRKFRDGLADKYWATRVTDHEDDPLDAKALTIALASVSDTVDKVETEAADRVRQWLDTYGDAIGELSEDKKAKYAEVRAMARAPELVTPGLPSGPITMPGDDTVPTHDKHLYADSSGKYRARLGTWEQHALNVEAARTSFVAWYRNPTGGQRALRVPYETGNGYGKLYPDFIVLHDAGKGKVRPSIIDPHGHHLADASDKLRGLADYAATHGTAYARIIAVIKNDAGAFRQLDLKDDTVRTALKDVRNQDDIESVFTKHGAAYM
jgi:type III restriction enzyme